MCNATVSIHFKHKRRDKMMSPFITAGRLPLVVLFLLVASANFVSTVKSGGNAVDIDLNTVVNVVSTEFVSFSIDPVQLLAMRERPQKMLNTMVKTIQPAYFRIDGNDANQWIEQTEVLASITRWLREHHLKPVITIPYNNPAISHPRPLMRILGALRSANITDCVWQLGSLLPPGTDPVAYVDDLLTLWHVREALGDRTWSVLGADLQLSQHDAETARLYEELTEQLTVATSYAQPESVAVVQASSMASNPSAHPLWLRLQADGDDGDHISRGLRWARTIGTAAQSGYAVVFQPIVAGDLQAPTLGHYVTLLHKKLLGAQVLRTRMLHDDGEDATADDDDRTTARIFAHCALDAPLSFAVMGVNPAAHAVRLATKLPGSVTGARVLQYILRSSDDGQQLLVNDRPVQLGDSLRAAAKTRKPNRPTSFVMPARSVAFWVFPEAKVRQCAETESLQTAQSEALPMYVKSPSEELLQQLIRERVLGDVADYDSGDDRRRNQRHITVKKDSNTASASAEQPQPAAEQLPVEQQRHKRQIMMAGPPPAPLAAGMHKLFGKFELTKPKKFQNLFKNNQNGAGARPGAHQTGPHQIPPVVSSVYDVYQANPAEQALFKSSENVDLPKGDVYMEVGPEQQSADYVAFDEAPTAGKKNGKAAKPTQQRYEDFPDVADDVELQRYPNQFLEFYPADGAQVAPPQTYPNEERWEHQAAAYDAVVLPADLTEQEQQQQRYAEKQAAVPKIVRGREPTWQENQDALRKAKTALEGIYYDGSSNGRGANFGRHKKMSMKSSAEDTFFQTRRRRRRSLPETTSDNKDSTERTAEAIVAEKPAAVSLSPYQERLLTKMARIMGELQRMIGRDSDETPSGSSHLVTLVDELRDIESYLLKGRKKPTGLFAKAAGVQKADGFFAGKSSSNANPLTADNIPRRCKMLAQSLEQQCLREIGASKAPSRSRRFPRSLPEEMAEWPEFETWWDERQPHEAERMAADDPRQNMIYKHGEAELPIVAFYVRNSNGGKVKVKEETLPAQFEGKGDSEGAKSTTSATLTTPGDGSEIVGATEKYHSPRFMVNWTRSMEGLMDVVNQHVAGWWQMMS